MFVLAPHVHGHSIRALRSAGAASVSDVVLRAPFQESAVGIVASVALVLVLVSLAQIVAHWHSAGFKLDRDFILSIFGLIGEPFGALVSSLLLRILFSFFRSRFLLVDHFLVLTGFLASQIKLILLFRLFRAKAELQTLVLVGRDGGGARRH